MQREEGEEGREASSVGRSHAHHWVVLPGRAREPGAALWRELLADFGAAALTGAGPLFAVGFDPADRTGTPCDFAALGLGADDAS